MQFETFVQFATFVLLQLDEACRFIRDGRTAQLRIALLLLDNTAEILMDRCIKDILSTDNFRELIRIQAIEIPPHKRTEDLQELVNWIPLTYKEKIAIHRNFDQKIEYLSQNNKSKLDPCFIKPLSHLHKYRNEAYHAAKIRNETLETATKLYLEIDCELFVTLSPGSLSYASNEDYSWIRTKFNTDPKFALLDDDFINTVIQDFKNQVNLNDKHVCQLLVGHIESRYKKIQAQIEHIMLISKWEDTNLMLFNCYKFADDIREHYGEIKPKRYLPQSNYTLEFLNSIYSQAGDIYKANNRLEAFRVFAKIESEMEPIETDLITVENELDHRIEMENEIARGK